MDGRNRAIKRLTQRNTKTHHLQTKAAKRSMFKRQPPATNDLRLPDADKNRKAMLDARSHKMKLAELEP